MEIRDIILSEHYLKEHFEVFNENRVGYVRAVSKIFSNPTLNKSLTLMTKARILTVFLQNCDREAMKKIYPCVDLPEMTKACEILDANRHTKQLTQKLERTKNRRRRNQIIKARDDQLKLTEEIFNLSLTSSKSRLVKMWVRGLTKEQLEYRALMFPTDLWRRLADLVHLSPHLDFAVDWFLPSCFGAELPPGSLISRAKNVTIDTFLSLYQEYPLPYEFVRVHLDLNKSYNNYQHHSQIDAIKAEIASHEKIETVLWYWHELHDQTVDEILAARLAKFIEQDSTLNSLSYGKLVELLMRVNHKKLFKELVQITEHRLQKYKLNLPSPVAVLSDASASMDIAIKTSSIVTSLLCSLTHAKLHLFNNEDHYINNPPKTIQKAIEFAKTMRASGSTSPASSLDFFYQNREVVKTFIIVTDEEENTSSAGSANYFGWGKSGGDMFAGLYQKYHREVYPAQLIFISFTDPSRDGQMVAELKKVMGEKMVNEFVQIFKFDVRNPDLNRLDNVLQRMQ